MTMMTLTQWHASYAAKMLEHCPQRLQFKLKWLENDPVYFGLCTSDACRQFLLDPVDPAYEFRNWLVDIAIVALSDGYYIATIVSDPLMKLDVLEEATCSA